MIAPHGGRLIEHTVQGERADALREEANTLPVVFLASKEAADVVLIATGAYSPLDGFLGPEAYHRVVETMHLPDGLPWTLPITLPLDEALAHRVRPGVRVALRAPGLLAVMEIEAVFSRDLEREARRVFGTTDARHPGVARLLGESPWIAGGPLWLVERPPSPFPRRTPDPREMRQIFDAAGWRTVTAFQTRNPIHRAHEYLQKCALEITDGLLLHPLVGETKEDDLPAALRMRSYEVLVEGYYPRDRVLLAAFPAAMRYAGPREAVFHAIVRKNFGCTHIIIGRDHAGVGDFYGPTDAQQIFREFDPESLGIVPLFFENAFFCRRCQGMATEKTCPHESTHHVRLSGTRLRHMILSGELPPPEIVRPEIARILAGARASPESGGERG